MHRALDFLSLSKRSHRIDDEIYKEFRAAFPTLNIQALDEDQLKSDKSKKKWRPFCMAFEQKHSVRSAPLSRVLSRIAAQDFNMATLLRLHAHKDYDPNNVCIGIPLGVRSLFISCATGRSQCRASSSSRWRSRAIVKGRMSAFSASTRLSWRSRKQLKAKRTAKRTTPQRQLQLLQVLQMRTRRTKLELQHLLDPLLTMHRARLLTSLRLRNLD